MRGRKIMSDSIIITLIICGTIVIIHWMNKRWKS